MASPLPPLHIPFFLPLTRSHATCFLVALSMVTCNTCAFSWLCCLPHTPLHILSPWGGGGGSIWDTDRHQLSNTISVLHNAIPSPHNPHKFPYCSKLIHSARKGSALNMAQGTIKDITVCLQRNLSARFCLWSERGGISGNAKCCLMSGESRKNAGIMADSLSWSHVQYCLNRAVVA